MQYPRDPINIRLPDSPRRIEDTDISCRIGLPIALFEDMTDDESPTSVVARNTENTHPAWHELTPKLAANSKAGIASDGPRKVLLNRSFSSNDDSCMVPKWKRYEPRTGWQYSPLTEIDATATAGALVSNRNSGCKYLRASRTCNAKTPNGRKMRLAASSPYDHRVGPWKTSPSPLKKELTLLERYPPREQCNVTDAIDMLTSMKIGKKIGFSNTIEIMK